MLVSAALAGSFAPAGLGFWAPVPGSAHANRLAAGENARRAPLRAAKLTVVLTAPRGVAVNATVRGARATPRVLAKPPSSARARFTLTVAPGQFGVLSPPLIFGGSLYAAGPGRRSLRLKAGQRVRIQIFYRALSLAHGLRASEVQRTSVSLAWAAAPGGRTVLLRRRAGERAPASPADGAPVPTRGQEALDRRLSPGTSYTYALFTRVARRWLGPVTLTVSTASLTPGVAAYSAPPSTVLAAATAGDAARVAGGGVDVALAPGAATPVIGAGFVLPVSAALPGGYLGRVASVSPDGRTVHLTAGGLADAFDYYRLNANLADTPLQSAHAARAPALAHSALAGGLFDCGVGLGVGVVLHAKIHPGGHSNIELVKKWGVPVAASFDIAAQLTVSLSADISVSGSISCGLKIPKLIQWVTLDPVPISIVFDPVAQASVSDELHADNVGYAVTGGFWAKGELGAHTSLQGGLTLQGAPTPQSSGWSSKLGLELGGEFTIGPGGGADEAGAIAGVGGELKPLVASIGPEFSDTADQRHTACLKATAGLESELNLNGKMWLGHFSDEVTLTIPALQRKIDYGTWYYPKDCNALPSPGGGSGGGTGGGASVTVTKPGDQTNNIGDQVNLQIHASAGDGGGLSYSASGLPQGLSINPASGLITGTPTTPGTSNVTVTVTAANGPSGSASFNWIVAPAGTSHASLSAGDEHSCALLSTGRVDCWGWNEWGQLGDASTTGPDCGGYCKSTPVQVSGITDATAVAAGVQSSCALLSTGHVACWGLNGLGQLGDGMTPGPPICYGTSGCSPTPVQVSGITDATAISVGNEHACALLASGQIDCWGWNYYGQLGNGGTTGPDCGGLCTATPVQVSGIENAVAVSAGDQHSCALLANGQVDCWGNNSTDHEGDLGDGTSTSSSTPVHVIGIADAIAISAGASYSCALLSSGQVECWGLNFTGELGNGTTANSSVPVHVSGITDAIAISAGSAHSCALLSNGQVNCWGDNEVGQLGNGSSTGPQTCDSAIACSTTPVQVSEIADAAAVSVGGGQSCALMSSGWIDCWGDNYYGQLGDGSTTNRSTPVQVSGIP